MKNKEDKALKKLTPKEKLVAQAQDLGLKTDKLTIAQLQIAIKQAVAKKQTTAADKKQASTDDKGTNQRPKKGFS